MADTRGFQEHWLNIDPERMERYETMYQWNPATEAFYTPAKIGEGHVVGDFGCGPGHAAIEFAKRVGPTGHVHALDINAEFVRRARARAEANSFGDRITVHLLEDVQLPLPDAGLDRMVARNTIIYVPDPVTTFGEFRRVLRPGGIAHAIEGDLNSHPLRVCLTRSHWRWFSEHDEIFAAKRAYSLDFGDPW